MCSYIHAHVHEAYAHTLAQDCGARIYGEDRRASILWGRWLMRNHSNGSFFQATLISEPPLQDDYTVEVLYTPVLLMTCAIVATRDSRMFKIRNLSSLRLNHGFVCVY
jgi:hypothetical protein